MPRSRWLTLWASEEEFIPEIDVSLGPINGAAMLAERHKPCVTGQSADKAGDATIAGSNPAAAPPSPTPAGSERVNSATTPSQEGPGTEREGEAWVPWNGGECPVPEATLVDIVLRGGDVWHSLFATYCAWKVQNISDDVIAYRLANPTPRGHCTLPPEHPHAALERLYMSDDTLRCWRLEGKDWWRLVVSQTPFWYPSRTYHVGHVPPKGEA